MCDYANYCFFYVGCCTGQVNSNCSGSFMICDPFGLCRESATPPPNGPCGTFRQCT
jgi:hypothetical protein